MTELVKIGEAAKRCGLSAGTLRNYEDQGLISPLRNRAGDRMYTDEIIKKIRQISGKKSANWIRHRKEGE